MNFEKAFFISAEYKDNVRKIQGGTAQIPANKTGDAAATIKRYGCDAVILGYIDNTDPTDADLRFIECCDAASLLVIPNCPLAGTVGPTLAEAHDPKWYNARFAEWENWRDIWGFKLTIADFEFYRNHCYAKMKNIARTPEFIAAFREMLLNVAWKVGMGWCFGGQNENKLGYTFIDICDEGIGLAGEFDDAAGAWKDDAHTIPATPAPDKFPPWFPQGKLVHSRRWCSLNGDWVKPGSVHRKTWMFSAAPDGVLYSTDDMLLANLGLA